MSNLFWNICRKLRTDPTKKNQGNADKGGDVGIKNELQNLEQTRDNIWYLWVCVFSLLRDPM